jgi:ribosomal protein L35AE/L33A
MKRAIQGLASALILLAIGCGMEGNQKAWKAVFLTSGQVYYGKITRAHGPFFKLEDVYYIRVTPTEDKNKPDLSLVKLGNEIHGPQDAIYLNRDHILYIEELKEDGQVVKAIAEAKAAGTSPAVAGQPPAPEASSTQPTPAAAAGAIPTNQEEQFKEFQKFLATQKATQKKEAANPPKTEKK